MISAHLPSFQPNEYVRNWLSTAQPEQAIAERDEFEQHPCKHGQNRSPERKSASQHRSKRRRSGKPPRREKTLPAAKEPSPQSDPLIHRSLSAPDPVECASKELRRDANILGVGMAKKRERDLDRRDEGMFNIDIACSAQIDHEPTLHRERRHDPTLKYARRPRRKTREDRYDYKGHEEAAKVQKIAGHNKRSARRKSGMALNEGFQAPNVESERLTLRQPSFPGFLNRGKTSGPVTLRGLPDLSFSEMSFLNKSRELDNARFKGEQEQTKAKMTRKGSAQYISEYFDQPGRAAIAGSHGHGNAFGISGHSQGFHNRSPPLSTQNHRQALSEVSLQHRRSDAGPSSDSKAVGTVNTWHADPYDSPLQRFRFSTDIRGRGIHQSQKTSQISWPPSIEHAQEGLNREQLSWLNETSHDDANFTTRERSFEHLAGIVHPRSSVSNVPHFAEREPALRCSTDDGFQTYSREQTHDSKHFYTLQDLIRLTRGLPVLDQPSSHHAVERVSLRGYPPVTDMMGLNPETLRFGHQIYNSADAGRQLTAEPLHDLKHEGFGKHHHCRSYLSKIQGSGSEHKPDDGYFIAQQNALAVFDDQSINCHDHAQENPGVSEPSQCINDVSNTYQRPLTSLESDIFDGQPHSRAQWKRDDGFDEFDAELQKLASGADHDVLAFDLRHGLSPDQNHTHHMRSNTILNTHEGTGAAGRSYLEQFESGDMFVRPGLAVAVDEQQCRPRLLRPSEEMAREVEPFTGFSRPRVLY